MHERLPTSRDIYRRASLQNEATCIRPPPLPSSHRFCAGSPHFILSPIILVHFSSRSCGQGKASRLVCLTPLYPLSTCTMTGLIYTEITSGGPIPLETTISRKTTVTYSTIENNVERVNVCPPIELLEYRLTDIAGYGRMRSAQLMWQRAGLAGALFELPRPSWKPNLHPRNAKGNVQSGWKRGPCPRSSKDISSIVSSNPSRGHPALMPALGPRPFIISNTDVLMAVSQNVLSRQNLSLVSFLLPYLTRYYDMGTSDSEVQICYPSTRSKPK